MKISLFAFLYCVSMMLLSSYVCNETNAKMLQGFVPIKIAYDTNKDGEADSVTEFAGGWVAGCYIIQRPPTSQELKEYKQL